MPALFRDTFPLLPPVWRIASKVNILDVWIPLGRKTVQRLVVKPDYIALPLWPMYALKPFDSLF